MYVWRADAGQLLVSKKALAVQLYAARSLVASRKKACEQLRVHLTLSGPLAAGRGSRPPFEQVTEL